LAVAPTENGIDLSQFLLTTGETHTPSHTTNGHRLKRLLIKPTHTHSLSKYLRKEILNPACFVVCGVWCDVCFFWGEGGGRKI
jgi:hypothetical protein